MGLFSSNRRSRVGLHVSEDFVIFVDIVSVFLASRTRTDLIRNSLVSGRFEVALRRSIANGLCPDSVPKDT